MTDNKTSSPRRAVLRRGLALVAAGTVMATTRAKAQEKLAQPLVQYQNNPKDGNQCNKCAQWQPPAGCAIVVSPIAATGWCVAYAPKEG